MSDLTSLIVFTASAENNKTGLLRNTLPEAINKILFLEKFYNSTNPDTPLAS